MQWRNLDACRHAADRQEPVPPFWMACAAPALQKVKAVSASARKTRFLHELGVPPKGGRLFMAGQNKIA